MSSVMCTLRPGSTVVKPSGIPQGPSAGSSQFKMKSRHQSGVFLKNRRPYHATSPRPVSCMHLYLCCTTCIIGDILCSVLEINMKSSVSVYS